MAYGNGGAHGIGTVANVSRPPEPTRALPAELIRLDANLDGVWQTLRELEERLQLVMMPDGPSTNEKASERPSVNQMNVAQAVSYQAERAQFIANKIASLVSRLEL